MKQRIAFIAIAAAVMAGAVLLYDCVKDYRIEKSAMSISIIGGADGPTAVFLAGKQDGPSDGLKLKAPEKQEEELTTLPLIVVTEAIAYTNQELAVSISNQTGYELTYGGAYSLQKKEEGAWVTMEVQKTKGEEKEKKTLEDLSTALELYDLSIFGTLEAGSYKLLAGDLETEFTLVEE